MAGPKLPAKPAIHGRDFPLPEHPESVPPEHDWGTRVPTSHPHPPKLTSEKEWPSGRTTSMRKTEWDSPEGTAGTPSPIGTGIKGTDHGVK